MADHLATYVGTYRFEGEEWAIRLQARSHGEAQARLRSIGLGRIDGELVAEIPAGMGWLARLACRVRNMLPARDLNPRGSVRAAPPGRPGSPPPPPPSK